MKKAILGIESSCDDTAAALVDEQGNVLSSVVHRQLHVHQKFGGVYPEFASREHVASIIPTVQVALSDANMTPDDVAAIAVTRGPGLIGSLLVGIDTAVGLSLGWDIPLIGVNHLRGHLRSADLEERRIVYPAIVLLVSGGHTQLVRMEDPSTIQLLGTTRDDSVGEAYDKVARMLGLGYPGGPAIDRLAKAGSPTLSLPRPMIHEGLDFSFSGLKTAVSRAIGPDVPPENVAASFVECCLDVLLTKCRRALSLHPAASLAVVGGVSASPQLREGAKTLCDELGVQLCLPPLKWSTDNAAMIAFAGWDYLREGIQPSIEADAKLSIADY